MKLFVGFATHSGRITTQTMRSFGNECRLAASVDVEILDAYATGMQTCMARDVLIADFMASGADTLAFVDDDVAWEPGALVKTALRPEAFVAGVYRFRTAEEAYPVTWDESRPMLVASATGLLPVLGVPAGFTFLRREVFEKLDAPFRNYRNGKRDLKAFFWNLPGGTEEGPLCTAWTALGEKIWVDPELWFSHDGYEGRLGDWLRRRMQEAA